MPDIAALSQAGFTLFATEHTSDFLSEQGVLNEKVYKVQTGKEPSVTKLLAKKGAIDLIINIPTRAFARGGGSESKDGYFIRRRAIDFNIPLITNRQLAEAFISALVSLKKGDLKVNDWGSYRNGI